MDRQHGFPQTWKEARRKRACELKQHGWKQREIAEAFAVSPAAVSQWLAHGREHGIEAWRGQPSPTGPITLTDDQRRLIPEFFSPGAEVYGFRGQFWTCARGATVIGEECGVSYHKAHVSRLLKTLHWTPPMPLQRAAQRDEAMIEPWRVQVWPERKKRRAEQAGLLWVWTNRGVISCRGSLERTRRADRHQSCGGRILAIMWR
jgi:transposase